MDNPRMLAIIFMYVEAKVAGDIREVEQAGVYSTLAFNISCVWRIAKL